MHLSAAVFAVLFLSSSALSQTYTISTFAGGGVPLNVIGTSEFFGTYQLDSVVADPSGNLFFGYQNSVLRLDAKSSLVTRVAGTGSAGFSGDGGSATFAQLSFVSGLALDSTGNLYVADFYNHRIRKITNGVITTIAGDGTQGFSGDNGPAVHAHLNWPAYLAVDAAGSVYFSDTGNVRVRKVSNGVITTVAGNGTTGFSGDGGPATNAQFNRLEAVAVDSAGSLYIVDSLNGRIRKVSNGVITTFAGKAENQGGPLGDNGPATSVYLVFPTGVATDGAGSVYISASQQILKVTNGVLTVVAGNGNEGFAGDNGPAANAELDNPQGITLDSAGKLYFVDLQNCRIRKVFNGIITTAAGTGCFSNASDSSGPALNAEFSTVVPVTVATNGDVYFAADNRVFQVSDGLVRSIAGNGTAGSSGDSGPAISAQVDAPGGLAVDSAGSIYLAGMDFRLRKITNGIITTIAGTGVGGFSGDGGPATLARISGGFGVAVDRANNIYFSDPGNSRIRKIANGVITTVAGTGVAGSGGDNGPAVGAQLDFPSGLAIDSSGAVYVADSFQHRIRRVSNGVITTVAGNGTQGFSGDGGPATSAQLNGPLGVSVDAAGNLYIADTENSRIRKVANGVITTIAGNGVRTFSGDNGPATAAGLSVPISLSVDAAGNVYLSDSNRVRVLRPTGSQCSYSVSPVAVQAHASGGNFSISVEIAPSCTWAIFGMPDWISASASPSGANAATVTLSVAANSGIQRTAAISVAGTLVQVTQTVPPTISSGGILNAASSAVGAPVAAGSLATAYGQFFVNGLQTASGTPFPYSLAGLSVQFGGGLMAPVYSITAGQVNFQVPWELKGQSQAPVSVTVSGETSLAQTVNLAPFAPGIFSTNGQGSGQGAILDTLNRLVDSSAPASAGSAVQIFCTGLGGVTNQPASGWPAPSEPLAFTTSIPTVTIGGAPAQVLFSGLTPGAVGLYQVNAFVPADSARGTAVPVVIAIGNSKSNTVTMAVQ